MNDHELLFRVYDLKRKKWIYAEPLYGISSTVPDSYTNLTVREKSFGVIQEFIGMMDCNAKDMYEGDIVQATAESKYAEDTGIYEIIFNQSDCQFQLRSAGYSHGLSPTWGGWKSLEVIGNIYETPELRPEPPTS